MPENAPPAVDEWAHDLTVSQLTCRDYGHAWRPLTARYADEGTIIRGQRCTRCRTEREQTLSLSGLILSGHYTYPDGYLAPAGIGRLTSADRGTLRVESITRLMSRA
jgi:hypothetical protein